MSGGISQLVAIGAQDAHLVGSPEVSFFRSNYKRHTNFSLATSKQVLQGKPAGTGISTVRFERSGDLLNYVYLTARNPSSDSIIEMSSDDWTSNVKKVELLIGGQVIDSQTSDFSEKIAVDTLAQNLSKSALGSHHNGQGATNSYFYPLRFSFFENWQSSIPLVALQYHDVEIRITWESTLDTTIDFGCYANYAFLDTDERTHFTNTTHDMLMTQVQEAKVADTKVAEFSFNHPVKFLAMSNVVTTSSPFFDASNKAKIQINGTDLDDFKYVVPHFTQVQSYYHLPYSVGNVDDFFVHSFGLDTNKLQPTGTLNFSRLDSSRLVSESQTFTGTIYALNYNVLRVQNGMGGVLYAN